MFHDSTLVTGRNSLLAVRRIQELNYNDFLGEPLASSLNQQFVLEGMEAFSRASQSKGVLRAATSLTQSLTARGLCIRLINLHIKNKAKSGTVTLTIVNCCNCHLPFKTMLRGLAQVTTSGVFNDKSPTVMASCWHSLPHRVAGWATSKSSDMGWAGPYARTRALQFFPVTTCSQCSWSGPIRMPIVLIMPVLIVLLLSLF